MMKLGKTLAMEQFSDLAEQVSNAHPQSRYDLNT